ncbi:MAG: glycosyltransferase family 4 protein [Alphaproteobacteria bacterium]
MGELQGPALRIALVISSFDAGGAERVASILCNRWARAGHAVTVLVWSPPSKPTHYPLDPSIDYIPLDLARNSTGPFDVARQNFRRLWRLRAALRRADPAIVVSFMVEQNVLAILAARSLRIPVVASERVHPGAHAIGRMRDAARRLTYPLADAIVVQTSDIADWFAARMNIRAVVLPNPLEPASFSSARRPDKNPFDPRLIVAVGRLEWQKGYDVLIAAFARVAARFTDWRLDIFGSGALEQDLRRRIAQAGLESRITLRGVVNDIPSILQSADVFVQASRYEGFSNTIVEALASGCCVIATDSPGATAEILQAGVYGTLVAPDDVDGLAAAMATFMADAARRESCARRAPAAVARYDAGAIAARWLDLLAGIAAASPGAEIRPAANDRATAK